MEPVCVRLYYHIFSYTALMCGGRLVGLEKKIAARKHLYSEKVLPCTPPCCRKVSIKSVFIQYSCTIYL